MKIFFVYRKINDYFKTMGISGILGLIAGIILLILKLPFSSGLALGVFFTRNGDKIYEYLNKLFFKNNNYYDAKN